MVTMFPRSPLWGRLSLALPAIAAGASTTLQWMLAGKSSIPQLDCVAGRYAARRLRYPAQLIDDLLMQGARTALDVGAGTGILSEQPLEKGVDVLAVEPDPRMAEVARRKTIPIEIGTFENWDAAQRRFDLVVFGPPFHWVNPDVGLTKAHRLLPSGGRLALIWNRVIPIHPTRSDLAEIYQGYMDPGSHLVDGSSNGPIDTEHRTDGLIVSITASGFTVEQRTYRAAPIDESRCGG
jgi:SAM-dependent methyltransferase